MTKRGIALLLAILMLVMAIPVFSLMGEANTLPRGDANNDTSIDMKDVLVIRKSIAGMGGTIDTVAADANADGSVDMKDVLLLRKFIAGMDVDLAPMPTASEASEVSEATESSDVSVETTTTATAVETTTTAGESTTATTSSEATTTSSETVTTTAVTSAEVTTTTTAATIATTATTAPVATTTTVASGDTATLTLNLLKKGKWTSGDATDTYTWNVQKGQTTTVTVTLQSVYKAGDKTETDLLAMVTMDGAFTLVGTPVIGPTVSHNNDVTFTYTVNITSNQTYSGTVSYYRDNPTVTVESTAGEPVGGSTTKATTTTTKAQSGTTTTTKAQSGTTTTKGSVVTDGYAVSLNVTGEVPRYTKITRTDSWTVAKGQSATIKIVFSVYRPNSDNASTLPGRVTLSANGSPLSVTYTVGTESNQKADVTYQATFTVNADTVISGSVNSSYNSFIVTINDEVGEGGITGGTGDADVIKSNRILFDQVMLSFYDSACSQYSLAWHTYKQSATPVLQVAEGTVTDSSAFAAQATTVSAYSTTLTEGGEIYADYNPSNGGTFTKGQLVENMPDYTHKALFPTTLKAGTTYSYRVGDSTTGDYSSIYTFTTKAAASSGFTFLFTSDTQWTSDDTKAGSKMNTLLTSMLTAVPNPAFMLSGGDMVDHQQSIHLWGALYGGNSSFFTKYPTFGNTGNHDSTTSMQNHFALKATTAWYSYDYQNTHFVVLDNGSSKYENSLGTEQLSWLTTDLNKAKTAGYDWIIVTFHKPLYAPLQWNQNKDTWSELDKSGIRSEVMNLFVDAGVDLVLQAHTHQYGRSYPMTGTTTYQTNYTTTNIGGVNYFGNLQGPIFTVMGCGCDRPDPALENRNSSYTENAYMAVATDGEDNSFGAIEVTSDKITVRVYHDGTGLYESYGLKK